MLPGHARYAAAPDFRASLPVQAFPRQRRSSGAPAGTRQTMVERTLIILKPDAIQRGLMGRILTRFEEKGLKLSLIHI